MTELAIVFVGVLISMVTVIGVLSLEYGARRRFNQRARRLGSVRFADVRIEPRELASQRSNAARNTMLERAATKILPRPSVLRLRLERTGRTISLGKYFLANVACGVLFGLAGSVFLPVPVYMTGMIAVALGIGIPHFLVGFMINRNKARFISVFPDAIDLMVRGLRSGLPVTETITACGREMTAPVGTEFRKIADLVKLGQTLEEALWDTAGRLDIAEFKFFVISLSVQKETGGNLAETLANLSEILRSRRQMRLKIKAMSSEARASALILGGLPFIMFGIIYFMSPDYISLLFTDQRGQLMLGGGLGLMALGGFVMHRMVRFEI